MRLPLGNWTEASSLTAIGASTLFPSCTCQHGRPTGHRPSYPSFRLEPHGREELEMETTRLLHPSIILSQFTASFAFSKRY